MLYSYLGQYPLPLPHRIRFSDGSTKTDSTTFTEEELSDLGYVYAGDPPDFEYPNVLDWINNEWVVREPNEQEIFTRWIEIKENCLKALAETDYKVIKAMELGQELDPAYTQFRQAYRDLYNNVNDIDPWFVHYPSLEEFQNL